MGMGTKSRYELIFKNYSINFPPACTQHSDSSVAMNVASECFTLGTADFHSVQLLDSSKKLGDSYFAWLCLGSHKQAQQSENVHPTLLKCFL